jgi:SAM-dependent methyltransferase
MYNTSKICDAADWFDPEIKFIIENELKEPARFHRKQWEFAMIFLTLKKNGLLNNKRVGLSLGGGNERVLYSIASHIKKLFVTDLYDENTSWDCARTTDPDEFIKSSKPFQVDDEKLRAMRMDMRFLEFEDNKFDFCYSSCAIEHIGDYQDFLQHLNEVNRVLKQGGVYIFTTELLFGDKTIGDPNNFVFSKDYLSKLISESDMEIVSDVNVELTNNHINYPFPSNVRNVAFLGDNYINDKLFNYFPHVILLRGGIPFTSVLLILRKCEKEKNAEKIHFINYDATKKFLLEGVESYNKIISENQISISPFSSLTDGVSRFFLDHSDFFKKKLNEAKLDDTIFHSDYFWFGKGKRDVKIKFKVDETLPDELNILQIRIHLYPTQESSNVHCLYEKDIIVDRNMSVEEVIELDTDENFNYAFLGKLISGNISCSSISIESKSINNSNKNSVASMELQGVTE